MLRHHDGQQGIPCGEWAKSSLLDRRKQVANRHAQPLRELFDAVERSVAHLPFDVRNKCSMKTRFKGERILTKPSLSTQPYDIQREYLSSRRSVFTFLHPPSFHGCCF